MTTFALVHGAWHGPWCWQRVRPELETRGHGVDAVDLPSEDPSLGSADYAAAVVRALEGVAGVFADGFGATLVRDELDRSYWPEGTAEQGMYPDCPPTTAAGAAAQLRRQSHLPSLETALLETWPEVEKTYILGKHDHAVDPAWSRRAARERLGVEPVELDAGHSPFLMCPRELAGLLG